MLKSIQKLTLGATGVCLTLFSVSANAALVSRLGGLAYYDTDADLTWLADANAGAGSVFDNGISTTDGRMTWQNANDWAANLNVAGVTGWRLPDTLQPDASCSGQLNQGASFPLQGFSAGCTGSEMGHLYNVDGITAAAPGPFSNVQSNRYWSGTEFAPSTDNAWYFNFFNGLQGVSDKNDNLFAWAVQSGDVSAVPVPAAVWLFGSGLLGLIGVARRKSANI